jgi:hypothetical protein
MSTGEKTITADAARLRAAPRCGARTRAGTACRAPAVRGRSRCRMHGCGGGKLRRSGAPRGNRNAWKDGYWAAAARLRRRRMTAFIRDVEASLAELEAMNRSPAHSSTRSLAGTFDRSASGAWGCFPFFRTDASPPALPASPVPPDRPWSRDYAPGFSIWSSSWLRLLISNSAQSGR